MQYAQSSGHPCTWLSDSPDLRYSTTSRARAGNASICSFVSNDTNVIAAPPNDVAAGRQRCRADGASQRRALPAGSVAPGPPSDPTGRWTVAVCPSSRDPGLTTARTPIMALPPLRPAERRSRSSNPVADDGPPFGVSTTIVNGLHSSREGPVSATTPGKTNNLLTRRARPAAAEHVRRFPSARLGTPVVDAFRPEPPTLGGPRQTSCWPRSIRGRPAMSTNQVVQLIDEGGVGIVEGDRALNIDQAGRPVHCCDRVGCRRDPTARRRSPRRCGTAARSVRR